MLTSMLAGWTDHILAALGPTRLSLEDAPRVVQVGAAARSFEWRSADVAATLAFSSEGEVAFRIERGATAIELQGNGAAPLPDEPPLLEHRPYFLHAVIADGQESAALERAVASFFDGSDVSLLAPPSLPRKWARLQKRMAIAPRATLASILPVGRTRLAWQAFGGRGRQVWYLLHAQPDGYVLHGLSPIGKSVRLSLALERGRPLPALRDLFRQNQSFPDVQALPGETGGDRTFGAKASYGLLSTRKGEPGREWLDVGLHTANVVREARWALGPPAVTAALDPTDPAAPWTVEWAVGGNINFVSGHPDGSALFAFSAPAPTGEPRRFEIVLHQALFWAEWLASVGLV